MPARWPVEVLLETTLERVYFAVPPDFATLEETPEGVVLRAYDDDLEHTARFLAGLGISMHVRQPTEYARRCGCWGRRWWGWRRRCSWISDRDLHAYSATFVPMACSIWRISLRHAAVAPLPLAPMLIGGSSVAVMSRYLAHFECRDLASTPQFRDASLLYNEEK